jgi:hypothetical protein
MYIDLGDEEARLSQPVWRLGIPSPFAPCPVSEPSCPDAFVSLGFVINAAYSGGGVLWGRGKGKVWVASPSLTRPLSLGTACRRIDLGCRPCGPPDALSPHPGQYLEQETTRVPHQ